VDIWRKKEFQIARQHVENAVPPNCVFVRYYFNMSSVSLSGKNPFGTSFLHHSEFLVQIVHLPLGDIHLNMPV